MFSGGALVTAVQKKGGILYPGRFCCRVPVRVSRACTHWGTSAVHGWPPTFLFRKPARFWNCTPLSRTEHRHRLQAALLPETSLAVSRRELNLSPSPGLGCSSLAECLPSMLEAWARPQHSENKLNCPEVAGRSEAPSSAGRGLRAFHVLLRFPTFLHHCLQQRCPARLCCVVVRFLVLSC